MFAKLSCRAWHCIICNVCTVRVSSTNEDCRQPYVTRKDVDEQCAHPIASCSPDSNPTHLTALPSTSPRSSR